VKIYPKLTILAVDACYASQPTSEKKETKDDAQNINSGKKKKSNVVHGKPQ
jgi:hypothetical protein